MDTTTPLPSTPAPRGVLAGLGLAMLLPALGTSIANVALPALARQFALPSTHVQWVVIAYLLTLTAAVVAAGRLGDVWGRRRLLLAGLALFALASLAAGAAPGLGWLIAARVAQGLGAAVMMALTLALVGEVVPKAQAGSAMGLLGTLSAVGTALGPSLGGLLLATWGWQAVFWVNVPLGLAALALAWWQLPPDRATPPRTVRFDHLGTALLALSLTAYALAMTLQPGAWGTLNTGLLLAAGLGLAAFAWVETRAPAPLLRLQTLRQPAVATGVAVNALITTVVMATLVVGPFYLAGGLGLDAARMGLVMTTGPAVAALAGAPAGKLVDQWGAARVTGAGLLLMLAGSAALPWASATWGALGYAATLAFITAGYASTQAANNTAVMASAPADQRGLVSGLVNLSRNLGLITGASAMGAVYQWGATATTEAGGLDALAGLRLAFGVAVGLVLAAMVVAGLGQRGARQG